MASELVPFISRSALFIRGMTAQCRTLGPLVALASSMPPERRPRCERLLETMFRRIPRLPHGAEDACRDLADADEARLRAMLATQRRTPTIELHALWLDCWNDEGDPVVRAFGIRCAIVLTELCRETTGDLTANGA